MNDNPFQLNLVEVMNAETGFEHSFKLSGKLEDDEEIHFIDDIKMNISVTRVGDGLMADGKILTKTELTCNLCGKPFEMKIDLGFSRYLSENPEDEYVIDKEWHFDFSQIARDEIILSLPIKIVCNNCRGV